jgi:DNA-binding transcriptional LysR family regulator
MEYFLSVAKHLNFTKAARECYVAQAAISQQVKQFEEEIGFRLFERGRNSVKLTPAGEYFAQQCQSILSQYHAAVRQGRAIADGGSQDLRLGISGYYRQDTIPGYLRQFRQRYPNGSIALREGTREELLSALNKGEVDVIVVHDTGLDLSGLEVLELSSTRTQFMTGPNTPLAGRKYVVPEELEGQTIFHIEGVGDSGGTQALPDYLARLGLEKNPIQRVKTILEASILVQAGLGIALLPDGMEGKVDRDVSVFSVEGDSFRIRTVALRLSGEEGTAAQGFFDVIRQDLKREKEEDSPLA